MYTFSERLWCNFIWVLARSKLQSSSRLLIKANDTVLKINDAGLDENHDYNSNIICSLVKEKRKWVKQKSLPKTTPKFRTVSNCDVLLPSSVTGK